MAAVSSLSLVLLQGDIYGFSKAISGQMQGACPPR